MSSPRSRESWIARSTRLAFYSILYSCEWLSHVTYRDVDSGGAVLTLSLCSTNLPAQRDKLRNTEAKTIFGKAQEAASVYDFDALTIYEGAEDTEFSFDDVLIDTPAYRAAFKQQTARNAASESQASIPSYQSPLSSKPSLRSPFSRKSSGNSSPWDQASTIAASETTQENNEKKKKTKWSFVPLGRSISENAQLKKDQKQLQEKLCAAAKKGDLMLVQELVELGAKPAEKTKRKQENCLVNAVQSGSTDVVKFLLGNGADPNARDPDSGLACLGIAFTRHAEKLEMLVALLKSGATPSDTYSLGDKSVGTGNIFHFLPNLIDQKPNMNVAATTRLILECNGLHEYSRLNYAKEYTPLQWACKKLKTATPQSNERLKVLIAAYIRKGAHIHDSYGKAVQNVSTSDIFLTFCADGEKPADVKFLLDQGANPNMINTRDGMKMTALHLASLTGKAETVGVLLEGGAVIDAKDAEGKRAIHLAVKGANLETLSLLLDRGADPDAITTNDGRTPLHVACLDSTTPLSIIKRLVAANADLEARDGKGMTPLLWSCCDGGRKEVLALLLDSNVSIESRGGEVNAPALHHAAATNNDVTLKYLIQRGADLESIDDSGCTAVHHACNAGSLDTLRILVAKGANVNATDITSETPLHVVISSWTDKKEKETRLTMISLLIASGANALARNSSWQTPQDLATKSYWKLYDTMEMLEEAENNPSAFTRSISDGFRDEQATATQSAAFMGQNSGNANPPITYASRPPPSPLQRPFEVSLWPPLSSLQQPSETRLWPSSCNCADCTFAQRISGQPLQECYCDQCLSREAPVPQPSQYVEPASEPEPLFAWERRVADGEAYYVNRYTGETSYVKPSAAVAPPAASPPPPIVLPVVPPVLEYHSTYTPCGCSDCESLPDGWECKMEDGELYYWNYLKFNRQEWRP
jgi:ankyrin repeat protein